MLSYAMRIFPRRIVEDPHSLQPIDWQLAWSTTGFLYIKTYPVVSINAHKWLQSAALFAYQLRRFIVGDF